MLRAEFVFYLVHPSPRKFYGQACLVFSDVPVQPVARKKEKKENIIIKTKKEKDLKVLTAKKIEKHEEHNHSRENIERKN